MGESQASCHEISDRTKYLNNCKTWLESTWALPRSSHYRHTGDLRLKFGLESVLFDALTSGSVETSSKSDMFSTYDTGTVLQERIGPILV